MARRPPAEDPVRFDHAYYERFYVDPSTRIYGDAHHARLVSAVTSLIDWFGGDLADVLDVGAGVGRWRSWFQKHRPDVEVVSTELDPDVCKRYGHLQKDISKWRGRRAFDLVVCQGVVPYLDDASAEKAIDNLAAMSQGFFYFEAITRRDLEEVCDTSRTDTRVHRRTGAWYRTRLCKHWREIGAGLWYRNDGPLEFFELEVPKAAPKAAPKTAPKTAS
jgi:hypothetical protein